MSHVPTVNWVKMALFKQKLPLHFKSIKQILEFTGVPRQRCWISAQAPSVSKKRTPKAQDHILLYKPYKLVQCKVYYRNVQFSALLVIRTPPRVPFYIMRALPISAPHSESDIQDSIYWHRIDWSDEWIMKCAFSSEHNIKHYNYQSAYSYSSLIKVSVVFHKSIISH